MRKVLGYERVANTVTPSLGARQVTRRSLLSRSSPARLTAATVGPVDRSERSRGVAGPWAAAARAVSREAPMASASRFRRTLRQRLGSLATVPLALLSLCLASTPCHAID